FGEPMLKNPMNGISGRCAATAKGHASAAPPICTMNCRRFTGSLPRPAPGHWERRTCRLLSPGGEGGPARAGQPEALARSAARYPRTVWAFGNKKDLASRSRLASLVLVDSAGTIIGA